MAMYRTRKNPRGGVSLRKIGVFGGITLRTVKTRKKADALKKKAGKKNPAQRHRYTKRKGIFSL